jgi:hypothetical protein
MREECFVASFYGRDDLTDSGEKLNRPAQPYERSSNYQLRMIMRILRPTIAFCTFAASLAVTWVLCVEYSPLLTLGETPGYSKREYRITESGKSETGDGQPASFTNYETSDGMHFLRWVEQYNSPRQVAGKLQERIKEAEILSREPVLNGQRRRVGEKLLVNFTPDVPKRMNAAMIWANGSGITIVQSSSIDNLLEYDKDSKR